MCGECNWPLEKEEKKTIEISVKEKPEEKPKERFGLDKMPC